MKRLVALYRSPTYSPEAHRRNDTAILDDTVVALEHRGWSVTRSGEGDVAAGRLPAAELYVNMCQGPAASERLLQLVETDLGGPLHLGGSDHVSRHEFAELIAEEST